VRAQEPIICRVPERRTREVSVSGWWRGSHRLQKMRFWLRICRLQIGWRVTRIGSFSLDSTQQEPGRATGRGAMWREEDKLTAAREGLRTLCLHVKRREEKVFLLLFPSPSKSQLCHLRLTTGAARRRVAELALHMFQLPRPCLQVLALKLHVVLRLEAGGRQEVGPKGRLEEEESRVVVGRWRWKWGACHTKGFWS